MAHDHPNGLLGSLSAADFAVLRPHLRPMELVQGTVLLDVGDPIEQIYFPHTGVVSLVVGLAAGETIEAAMVGRGSLVGGSSALDGGVALNKAVAQIAGAASVLDLGYLRSLAEKSAGFRTILLHHDQMILVQAQQSAACNISHTIEERLARWLLRCRDLMGSDKLALTQEFLGQMLGVRRTSVSIVAGSLQRAGLIHYRRGHLQIENVEGLQRASCGCYEAVRMQSHRLLGSHG
jgi:CRP-like cAMP-binding protein